MKTLHTHFEKKKEFIKDSHKQLYIKIAEEEIERLENNTIYKAKWSKDANRESHGSYMIRGTKLAIQEEINYWNNILQELNK